eukprot:2679287-Prymnesium_polylepis.1
MPEVAARLWRDRGDELGRALKTAAERVDSAALRRACPSRRAAGASRAVRVRPSARCLLVDRVARLGVRIPLLPRSAVGIDRERRVRPQPEHRAEQPQESHIPSCSGGERRDRGVRVVDHAKAGRRAARAAGPLSNHAAVAGQDGRAHADRRGSPHRALDLCRVGRGRRLLRRAWPQGADHQLGAYAPRKGPQPSRRDLPPRAQPLRECCAQAGA